MACIDSVSARERPKLSTAPATAQRRGLTRAAIAAAGVCTRVLTLLLAASAVSAQPGVDAWVGQPSLTRFAPADTDAHPYSFSVLALDDGQVFVGNSAGLLRYFGQRWQRIELPGAGAARSLALGADGRIYVGGYQDFGVLTRGHDGRYEFASLERNFFPESVGAPLGEVWDTVAVAEGVYFATSHTLFFAGYDGSRATIPLPGRLLAMFAPGGLPVVALRDHQLFHLQGTELRPWVRAPARVRGLAQISNGQYWLLTDAGRLYRVDGSALRAQPFAAEAMLRSAAPYVMVALPGSGYAIGTLSGDIVRVDQDFSRHSVWPTGPAPVIGLAVDPENHLWAATEADILRLSLSDAWSLIDRSTGLRGPVTHAAVYRDRLYVSTSVGLYGAQRDPAGVSRFEAVALAQSEVNHLATTPIGLLIAAREGIYLWRDGQLQVMVDGALVWRLFQSRVIAERYYAVEDSGLSVLDRAGERYQLTQRFNDPLFRFDEIAEAADGSLLVDRLLDDPMRFPMHPDRRLGAPVAVDVSAERGVDRSAAVLEIDGRAMIATETALLASDGDSFVPIATHPLIDGGLAPASDLRARTCGDGSVFAFNARRLLRRETDPRQPFVELRPMDGGTRGVIDVQCSGADGVAWIGTWSGMVRFDPRAARSPPLHSAPVMERVRLDAADGNSHWLPLQPDSVELPDFRQVRFEYASPSISTRLRYQSRLSGHEQSWVDGGSEGYREFGALPPGDYLFQVRAIDETGVPTPVLGYPLRVPAAWYQTIWFAVAALAWVVVLFLLLLRWRSRTLERRNRELEALVSERTEALAQRSHELELVNKRLSELADLDGLTGVANRRKLEHELDHAWSAARAADAHLSMLLIDVDQFKQFNDTYGHALGDERLKALAGRLAGWVGPGETLARYGGEEFVLLMPGSSLEVAIERAEAIRRDARHAGQEGSRSSISIGIAERIKHRPSSAAQLFEFADLALYRAKNAGRDRVEVYTE
jgi:diguanylate cyclase (GGDEF)-like protein